MEEPGVSEASLTVRFSAAGASGDAEHDKKKGLGSVRHLSAVVRRELKQAWHIHSLFFDTFWQRLLWLKALTFVLDAEKAGYSKDAVDRCVLPKEGLKKLTARECWHVDTHRTQFRQLQKSRRAMETFFEEVIRVSEELESVCGHWREFLGRDVASDRDWPHQSVEQRHAQVMNQYFTSTANAEALMSWLRSCLSVKLWDESWFIEPSAGCGVIYSLFPSDRRVGVELDPKLCIEASCRGLQFAEGDFLLQTRKSLGLQGVDRRSTIVVGNPPYVARDEGLCVVPDRSLLLSFICHSLSLADHVALVLPKQCQSEAFQDEVRAGWLAYQDAAHVDGIPDAVMARVNLDVITVPAPDDIFSFCGKMVRRKSAFQLWRAARAEQRTGYR